MEESFNREFKNKKITFLIYPKSKPVVVEGEINNVTVYLDDGQYAKNVKLINCKTNDIRYEFEGEISHTPVLKDLYFKCEVYDFKKLYGKTHEISGTNNDKNADKNTVNTTIRFFNALTLNAKRR